MRTSSSTHLGRGFRALRLLLIAEGLAQRLANPIHALHSVYDQRDNRRQTSMITHSKEYTPCKEKFGKVTNGWLQPSTNKI